MSSQRNFFIILFIIHFLVLIPNALCAQESSEQLGIIRLICSVVSFVVIFTLAFYFFCCCGRNSRRPPVPETISHEQFLAYLQQARDSNSQRLWEVLIQHQNIKSKHSDTSQTDCAICLEKLRKVDETNEDDVNYRTIKLPCGHAFHNACILQWVMTKSVSVDCPVCKSSVAQGLGESYV
eukprot:TRINITY_DN3409_c1_g1_i14.p3 TRINITY_DN3409_c1_g1~~TRINITY_DN3409_c1_g1_i14.p3  ORF type:complete len:180 (+),score=4.92 TRINITY_DN3409_c1_g1_i14:110-649(+)